MLLWNKSKINIYQVNIKSSQIGYIDEDEYLLDKVLRH